MKSLALAVLHVEKSPETIPLGAGCVLAALRSDPWLAGKAKFFIVEDSVSVQSEIFASAVLATHPDYVGISLFSWNREKAAHVCAILRRRKPDIIIFAGGPEATADASALDIEGIFDFIICGEGENNVVQAVSLLVSGKKISSSVFREKPEPLENLVSPWLSGALNPHAWEGCVLWELSRGCPFTCAYCFEGKGEKGVRHFPLPRIVAELDLFVRSGVTQAFILDPTFNISKSRTADLLRLFREKAPGIHWKFEIRAELLDREQANLFGKLDCSVQIGLQSAHPKVLAIVNRTIDRVDFRRKLALLDAAGVPFGLDLIYGLPGDSLMGFRESLDFALSLAPNHLDIFPLTVLPGTELSDRKLEYGLEVSSGTPHLVVSAPGFPNADIRRAAALAKACDLFYSRGRAVGWFGQVRSALGMRSATLVESFGRFILNSAGDSPHAGAVCDKADSGQSDLADQSDWHGRLSSARITDLQLAFLTELFRARKKERLLPAINDIIRFNSAWARALAEKESTELTLSYDPDLILGPAAVDLVRFVAEFPPKRSVLMVSPGPHGPQTRSGRRR